MSIKNSGILLLSSLLTFSTPNLPAQTNIESQKTAENQGKTTASRNEIEKAQQALKDKSLYKGPVNGQLNPEFEKVLREFQTGNQMQGTGKLDNETMIKLGIVNV